MTEEDKREIEQYIDDAIDRALEKIQKKRYMKESSRVRYAEVSSVLFQYYREGMKDEQMTKALKELMYDAYYAIIPLYYSEQMTIEALADRYGVDISTIVRNKKRLCLELDMLL